MLLKELTQAFGVSGFEKEIANIIIENIKACVDELKIDAIGNVIALKRGIGEEKKKIMVSSHMDEIGFGVLGVTDKGFVKVKKVGGISPQVSFMNRVQFKNGTCGTISSFEKMDKVGATDIHKLYVDICAVSKEDALKYVSIGEPASYMGEYKELHNHCVTAKAIDDRIGCYILIEALKKVKDPYHDIYFVFSVQEEVGLIGATVAAERINPDLGIAVDITGSFDVPTDTDGNAVIGGGAAIKVMDSSVICDEELVKTMVQCAEKNNIKYQLDALAGGGTDAGAINKSNCGVKALGISIPTRYGHSPNGIVSMEDVNACVDLLWKFSESTFQFTTEKQYV
ncbi:M42 family metallopeptidase [Irregularibacter muris]|uniref:M42 family metallopeptidase n=1 Tax=Irregularibacter muris TaxID=1796619 RepID=A0AAE3HE44_9FIRM|nr:M42 family metallopeptidase [Irregularibacter muris]MCR1898451.1 M42 family metallopeptidase [Irregularibacter muris]